ncbi:major facilitator superfamily multidrug-resistance, DHA1 sub-family [Mycena maculata]|uniref:Major facilitator superfamily multidrug-resistance, DHA1 sub-family n=1 Tax=Mycena maculata TaxID=230809 RepID=A0AAD7MYH4_9AGAR|nr:major facilitator superfamily multidrug-resistance, DHA1 sub-family [Mycena maculata]
MHDDEARAQSGGERAEAASKKPTPIPKFQVFILLFIQFAEPITALVIYPFVVQFVRDTGITGGDEAKTGFYAGLLESAFFLAESFTVFHFGRMSDIYGRRPTLLLAPVGLGIAMLGFGLSKTFWTLFLFRCAQGAFNGNIGVAKTVMNEISDSSNAADIFSLIPLMWSVGATMSPFMGGVLANPAAKWPDTLGKIHFLWTHPYFLPCAVAACIAFISFAFAFVGLRETLPSAIARQNKKHKKRNDFASDTDPLLPTPGHLVEQPDTAESMLPLRDLLTRPVLIAVLNHGLLCFCDMSYESLLPLVYATPIGLGGLGLKPYDIGLIMGVCGICNALVQTFLGGRVIRYFGPRRIFTASFCALILAFSAYPLLSFFAERAGRIDTAVVVVLVFQLSCSFFLYFAFSTGMIFIMDAVPNKASVGSVSGLAQMVGTTLRSLAPSFASSLFSLSVKNNLAGGYMVYIILVGLTLGAVRCSFLLPRQLRSESENQR